MRVTLAVTVLLGACAIDAAGRAGTDAGGRDATEPPRDAGPDTGLDAGTDAGQRDAGTDAGPVDAGPPPVPTEPVSLAGSGPFASHAAVAWTGTEFVLGYLVSAGGGAHVEIAFMPPGGAPERTMRITSSAAPRRSVAVAPRGSTVAVGWAEESGAEHRLYVRTVPSGPSGDYYPVRANSDHDDLQVMWDGPDLTAVVRRPGEDLFPVRFDGSALGSPFATSGDFGDVRDLDTRGAPAILASTSREIFRLQSGTFTRIATMTGFTTTPEGDAAELSDGSFLAVISETSSDPRTLYTVKLRNAGDGTLAQDASPVALGWDGPDPAVAAAGDRVVVVWCDETDGMRPVGLGMLDADGSVLVDRCALPMDRPVSNDPDVACGGGWCAIVWLEGDAYEDPVLFSKVMQVPVTTDRSRFCP